VPRKSASSLIVPIAVVGVVVMMVVPLPTAALDLLLACNISGSLLILLVSMNVRRPLEFSVFPSLLLVATLFRLALNVSVTRLVLLDGYAGKVVDAFGHFVVGGSLVVGLVIFLILIVIQFIVITNGAGRVAEVGARFTLDAMPGKQMAIDADLNAGLIDEVTARARRADVAAEADFYGAMDGGTKFVKGDAIAAIIITLINLIGGLIVGVVIRHMPIGQAISTYSLLSVGDGLVSQIPALLLSVSTGLIVTRSTTHGDMGTDMMTQFGAQKSATRMAGFAALAICVIPGMPKLPFLVVGGGLLFIASRQANADDDADETTAAAKAPVLSPDSGEAIVEDMRVDPLSLDLACDIVDLVDTANGGDLLDRVRALRRKMAMDLGILLPLVRTRDDLDLPLSTYSIQLGGIEAARGQAPPGAVLAIGESLGSLPGAPTREPVFGLAAKWIPAELRQQAELAGATVVDRSSVITTHLAEVVRRNASRLLGREDVRTLTEAIKRTHPVVVEELTPALLNLGEIQRVLQMLLDDGVAIRDLVRIFEAMSLRAKTNQDPESLTEAVRAALGPAIAAPYHKDGVLRVMTLEPTLEQNLLQAIRPAENGSFLVLEGPQVDGITGNVLDIAERSEQRGETPVLVCSAHLRSPLRKLLKVTAPRVPVLSFAELGDTAQIETIGVVDVTHALAL